MKGLPVLCEMEENLHIADLIAAYLQGHLTEVEEAELINWLDEKPENKRIFESVVNERQLDADLTAIKSIESEKVLEYIKKHPQLIVAPKVRYLRWSRVAAAASIFLCLSIGSYYILHKKESRQVALDQIHNDIIPGSNKATLTLSNGKQISLADAQNGILAKEGNRLVKKAGNGTISYESDNTAEKDQSLAYNTITTPRGGQWPLILPDGTKVMLDAASSIKYPVSFTGNERKVEITGQAYFEVVHNAAKPFRVLTKSQVVEDIGTKFNINAYDDEPAIKTTLLEGAVKVSVSNNPGLMLKPGQQTIWQNNKLTVAEANTEEALDWKNGYLNLDDENIQSIMRKLSRWYDIQVEYKGNIPNMTLRGEIPRNTPISQVLKVLEDADFHFDVKGKKIIVTP